MFLHSTLTEIVYYIQLSGFDDPDHLDFCLSSEQVPVWVEAGSSCLVQSVPTHLLSLGFLEAKLDTWLFVYRRGSSTTYLLLYADDIVLTMLRLQLSFGGLFQLSSRSSP